MGEVASEVGSVEDSSHAATEEVESGGVPAGAARIAGREVPVDMDCSGPMDASPGGPAELDVDPVDSVALGSTPPEYVQASAELNSGIERTGESAEPMPSTEPAPELPLTIRVEYQGIPPVFAQAIASLNREPELPARFPEPLPAAAAGAMVDDPDEPPPTLPAELGTVPVVPLESPAIVPPVMGDIDTAILNASQTEDTEPLDSEFLLLRPLRTRVPIEPERLQALDPASGQSANETLDTRDRPGSDADPSQPEAAAVEPASNLDSGLPEVAVARPMGDWVLPGLTAARPGDDTVPSLSESAVAAPANEVVGGQLGSPVATPAINPDQLRLTENQPGPPNPPEASAGPALGVSPSEAWPIFSDALDRARDTPGQFELGVAWGFTPLTHVPAGLEVTPTGATGEVPPSAPRGVVPATSIPSPASTWTGPDSEPSVAAERRPRKAAVLWAVSLVVAFFVGVALKSASSGEPSPSAASSSGLRTVNPAANAGPNLRGEREITIPSGTRPLDQLERAAPGERSKLEAIALGRYWSKRKLDLLEQLGHELRRNPKELEDAKIRAKVLEFVTDRATSRSTLELLVELDNPRALDLLYKIWTGSKERTDTTRLAESLLLAKDVRPRVSPSLQVALSLRDKPTACLVVRQLVERALTHADRRSVMLLIALGARQNCGDQQTMECLKCLEDPKELRHATKEAAARVDPIL